jgi:hypothetical protein
MVNLLVHGEANGVPFPCFGIKLSDDEIPKEFVATVEQEAWEIIGDISDKEFLVWRAIAGTMPWLNHVFEDLGTHHDEHKVPPKVIKLLEDKAKKAAVKNTTVTAEAKKRKGSGQVRAVSKKQKVGSTSAATFVGTGEEVAKNVGGGSATTPLSTEGEQSAAFTDLGGNDFVGTAI